MSESGQYARSRHKCAATVGAESGTVVGMDDVTADDLLLDMIESITLDVLARLGDDPDARYEFFKPFVALAREAGGWPGRLT